MLRARQIKLVLTDNDGVLTDTGVYYSAEGEIMKRFSIRDGMGVELLRKDGVETGIITGELSESIAKRAEKLKIQHLHQGIKEKTDCLTGILESTGLTESEIAYIGDDVNDITIMNRIYPLGITAAPADAMPVIQEMVHYVCAAPGGHGAFRDFADFLLDLRIEGSL